MKQRTPLFAAVVTLILVTGGDPSGRHSISNASQWNSSHENELRRHRSARRRRKNLLLRNEINAGT